MAVEYLITSFISLFLIVDAIGNVPLFEALLHGLAHRERVRTITLSIIVSLVTLIVLTYLGIYIFNFFSIKLYSFKIAGGILIFIIALQMLFGIRQRLSAREESEVVKRTDIAIVPMAIPLQTGPGAITTGILLSTRATNLTTQVLLLFSILLVFLVSYIIYVRAEFFFKLLGETGTKVITRIMGLILVAIAVQFIMDGTGEAYAAIKAAAAV
ncbi:TPA: NAAT family transporter [archaeon]|uniref:UPF0056 membrane protein n=1 Tax=Candidatus Naiadarchaeum limnaeum TaxID=2756139 RepID=A0A832V5F1_9ARCH|nr:NAAT family transporter [Candidatus Naiadarchaeum limnaeum]